MGKDTGALSWSQRRIRAAGRRAEIIEAVLQLVEEHGVAGTTTARIAAAVGVTEPTLYTYFENRQEMLVSALDVLFDQVADVIRLKPDVDPVQQLRDLARGHTDEVLGRRYRFVGRLFEFIVSPQATGLRARVRERSLDIIEILRAIVAEGQRQGRIRPNVDATRVAWQIMGFYWMEDMSGLQDMGYMVEQHIPSGYFDGIINQIVIEAEVPNSQLV
jgi:AcrR family transcriptional regulator